MVKIVNPKLQKLDGEMAEFYRLSGRTLCSPANLHGREAYKAAYQAVKQRIDALDVVAPFDKLILANIKSNITKNDLVIDFFSDPHFSIGVEKFFDLIAGAGAFRYLQEKMRTPPWKLKWEFDAKNQLRWFKRVSSFTAEAQAAGKGWLPRIKNDVIAYGKQHGYLPENFDMTMLLLPPRENGESSSWNSSTHVFQLGSYAFEFLPEKGTVIARPQLAYEVAFHEVLGHAGHQTFSKGLPESIRFTEEVGMITPTKSVTEGVAWNRQKRGHAYLRSRLAELHLTEEDIQLLEMQFVLNEQYQCEMMYTALIKDKELREEDFDGFKHILELTKNPVIAKHYKNHFKAEFISVWRSFGHTMAPYHYQMMLEKVKAEFGTAFVDNNQTLINQATASGVWAWDVYPDAVCYFLKRLTHGSEIQVAIHAD